MRALAAAGWARVGARDRGEKVGGCAQARAQQRAREGAGEMAVGEWDWWADWQEREEAGMGTDATVLAWRLRAHQGRLAAESVW